MVSGPLNIELHPEGEHLEVVLTGEVDVSSCEALHDCLAQGAASYDEVVLDLAGVTFMDSTGVAEIIRTAQHLEPDGRTFRLRNPHPHVLRLLEVTGLTQLLSE
jgi:anti-sigma B factor antagonist